MVVGEQVQNALGDKADLVGLLPNGDLVVIEVKRDVSDIQGRQELLEWQAIRYASSIATIRTREVLVERLFFAYLQKHPEKAGEGAESLEDKAYRTLDEFLEIDESEDERYFNRRQQILLVASEFDERTLAASAWLVKNQVPLRCITLTPHEFEGHILMEATTLLPPDRLEDWFIEIGAKKAGKAKPTGGGTPKGFWMRQLFDAGLLKAGDHLYVKKAPDKRAKLVDPDTVDFEGQKMSPTQWGIKATGWSSFSVFDSAFLEGADVRIRELRAKLEKGQSA